MSKLGKLPHETYKESYSLEYGDINTIEIHVDAIVENQKVVIIDDLILKGGR